MRLILAMAYLGIVGIAAMDPAHAAIKQNTTIAAQGLGPALTTLAKTFDLKLLYSGDIVGPRQTQGVSGAMTAAEALEQVLSGTGLTYRYVNDRTVEITLSDAAPASAAPGSADAPQLDGTPAAQQGEAPAKALRLSQASSTADASPGPEPRSADAKDSAADSEALNTVTVTGSRIVRDGYQAPTPVTVLGSDMLDQMANPNIADSLNELPQFTTSVTQTSQVGGFSGGTLGVNQLNLRGLGAQRTLVLLDGKRIVNASIDTQFSAPDINTIPDALVSRVDVVTGGASAAYGSDALSGVVNFVLDHDFTGVKGKLEGGATTYDDNAQYTASLTAGTKFGPESRGHALLSIEEVHNDGVHGNLRPWEAGGGSVFANPAWTATNGLPYWLTLRNVGISDAAPGGLITGGPLQGTYFGQGGTPTQFNYGLVTANSVMQGGDWQMTRTDTIADLVASNTRSILYGRLSYDVSDDVQVYGELQYADSRDQDNSLPSLQQAGAVTVQSGNPFIPAAVQAQMTAQGLPSIPLGTENADIGQSRTNVLRVLGRVALGASGHFDALGSVWSWDGYIQQSRNNMNQNVSNDVNTVNYAQAVNAVRNPTTGAIVCASTLANPGDGCVPYNPLGVGVNSRAAIDYVTGTSHIHQTLRQDVEALNLHGEPFSTWAAPVSVALGVEHRREAISGLATPEDEANDYVWGNYHATFGAYRVTEGYFETVVPLAKDQFWTKSLDLNGAVRETGYSTSGKVTTYKIGLNWAPVNDVRFRVTRSRDIRAPNLGELFSGGQSSNGLSYVDFGTSPSHQTPSSLVTLASGNLNLKPEIADSTGVGFVFTPSFLPGFTASVDYYDIEISGAVSIPTGQTIIDLCYIENNPAACSLIAPRVNGEIVEIQTSPANISSQSAKGIDLDATYHVALSDLVNPWKGDVTIHGLGTFVSSMRRVDVAGDGLGNVTTTVTQGAGVVGYYGEPTGFSNMAPAAPKWRHDLFLTYALDPVSATLTWHYIAPGVYNKAYASCTSGCPVGSQDSIDDNHIGSNSTFDLALIYKPLKANNSNVFFSVENLTNKYPPFIGGNAGFTYAIGQYNYNYDRIGRTYKAGVKFEF